MQIQFFVPQGLIRFFKGMRNFFCVKWLSSIYLNFRMLPFRQAIHFPIVAYTPVRCHSLRGRITILSDEVSCSMIQLGRRASEETFCSRGAISLIVKGELRFIGKAEICTGTSICIENNGLLEMHNNSKIGEECVVYCERSIVLEESARISFRTVIMDSSCHYIRNHSGDLFPEEESKLPALADLLLTEDYVKSVHIGKYNWIGNSAQIQAGTYTPDHLIVTAGSVLSGDYRTTIPSYSLIGGVPAHMIRSNCERVDDPQLKKLLNDHYKRGVSFSK